MPYNTVPEIQKRILEIKAEKQRIRREFAQLQVQVRTRWKEIQSSLATKELTTEERTRQENAFKTKLVGFLRDKKDKMITQGRELIKEEMALAEKLNTLSSTPTSHLRLQPTENAFGTSQRR